MNKSQKDNKINQYDKLVIDISNNLSISLSNMMSKLLDTAQEELFNMSNAADNNEEQARYFELMNQLRTLKQSIADTFNQKIKAYLLPAKEFEEKQKKQKSIDDDDDLSLVGQDEMEGIVLVKGIGQHAAGKYREELSHLEARLEHLALKTTNVFKQDALEPTNFCQAFDDALADNFDNTNKRLLFSMFSAEITNKLDDLYDSINNRLIDADILPQIKIHMDRQKSSQAAHAKPSPEATSQTDGEMQQNDTTEGGSGSAAGGGGYTGSSAAQGGGGGSAAGGGGYAGSSAAQGGGGGSAAGGGGYAGSSAAQGGGGSAATGGGSGGGSNIGGFAMTAAPGGTYRHTNLSTAQSQASSGTENTGNNPATVSGNYTGGANNNTASNQTHNQNTSTGSADGSAEYQHYTSGMPASQVSRILGNYIGAPFTPNTSDKSSKDHAEFFPQSTSQHFGHQEIIQALSNIQNLPQFASSEEVHFDGEAIKQAILAEIAKTSGGAVLKGINQIAEKTIDFIKLIFDAIIDDEDISDTIKTLLLRLQIPIIKTSMSDQEFFIYDNHPARVLLDTIAEAGIGITDHDDKMYQRLDKIVSTILGDYELNTETFQTALDNLNAIIEKQEAITRTKEEEEQKQVLRKHARATVLKALRATTASKILPEAVHTLILKRWPTLMFNHYLSNGKENNSWINMVLTLRHIIESVQPINSAERLAKLSSEKDTLFKQTEQYLNIYSNSKKDVQNIMDGFLETVQANIDDANFTAEEVSVAEETISKAEPVEEQVVEEEAIDKPTVPHNIMPGNWFQVHMGEGKAPRRCKLSVIIIEDANLMFVNQRGQLLIEKSFDELNEELANNKTKMILCHSPFDYAFKTVINRLN